MEGIQAKHYNSKLNGPGLSYLKAKQHAEELQMSYMLFFHAEWSSPSRWMQESMDASTAFQDAVDNDFIFVEVDIDGFEGYALKNYFQVSSLPTIIVFNHKHEITHRIIESSTADKILRVLKIESANTTNGVQALSKIEKKEIYREPEVLQQVTNIKIKEKNEGRDEVQQDLPQKNQIFIQDFYTVQVGAFSSLENAQALVERIKIYTSAQLEIVSVASQNHVVNKVLVGRYEREDQAIDLQNALKAYGVDGFVKSISNSKKG